MHLLPAFTGVPRVNEVYHYPALDLLALLPDKSVDAFITDLPYGTTACSWDEIIPFEPMWEQVRRTLKPRGVFVTTATEPFASLLRISALDMYKYDWTWVKTRPSDHFRAKLKPLNLTEDILIFSCGTVANASDRQLAYYPQGLVRGNFIKKRKAIASGGMIGRRPSHKASYSYNAKNYPISVLYFHSEHNVGAYHPTQKPVALYDYLIRTYTQPNELVVDFCCGSGTTAVAARNLGRNFICGDITLEYVETARKRLAQPYTPNMFIQLEQREKVMSMTEGV